MAEIKRFKPENTFNYIYRMDIEFYVPDKDIKIKAKKILHAIKDSNYATNFMPTLKVEMLIDKLDFFKLEEYQSELLAKITITSYKYNTKIDSGTNSIGSGELVDTSIELDEIFEPIFESGTFPTHYRTEEFEDDRHYSNDPGHINLPNETMTKNVMCNFFNLTGILLNKTTFNIIFGETTVGSALLYLLNSLNVKRIIVDPPINTSEYTNIIIPPHNFRASLEELQTRYGIYENGILVFYDFNTLYILDRYSTTHEFEEGDTMSSKVQVYEVDKNPQLILNISEDTDHTIYYDASIYLEKNDTVIATGEIVGNAFMFSNFKMGLNSVVYKDGRFQPDKSSPAAAVLLRDGETHKSSGVKIIMDYDELSNPYNIASYFNSSETLKNQYNFSLTGVNIKSFKPNKFIDLVYENVTKNNKFGGSYIMTRNILTFESNNAMSPDLTCSANIFITRKII